MQNPAPTKNDARPPASSRFDQSLSDLRFISDLGRSLLVTVHPKKVAASVADAIRQSLDAEICVFAAELKSIGLISCAVSRDGAVDTDFLDRTAFEKWLSFMPPQVGYSESDRGEFIIEGVEHSLEYVSPLHIDGAISGAILTGFAGTDSLTEQQTRLIDAATQMAAMSVNLTAHYESPLNDSINQAREEHRKFTESVLDALPVSLYVVDRDYRIVTWNRHREVGDQGIPRDIRDRAGRLRCS